MFATIGHLRERAAHTRCPYCHDFLVDAALRAIQCPGCHSSHHQACIQELGRCSVHGCAQVLFDMGPDDASSRYGSAAVRRIRRRMRERVNRFVRSNTRTLGERITYATERAETAEGSGRWSSAGDAWREVAYLEEAARLRFEGSLCGAGERMSPQEARERAVRCDRGELLAMTRLAGTIVASLFGTFVAAAFALAACA